MQRTKTGRRIALSARDFELFKLLTRYRYLRSTYLYAFVGGLSETRFKERLGDLFHEGYLDRPHQQWEYVDARCRPVVHEIGARSLDVLGESGEPIGNATFLSSTSHRQFRHSLMICEVMASIELGCRQSGLRFLSWPEILARAPEATQSSATPWRLPLPMGGYLVPDGLFGIEYLVGESKSYRFFALEIDRGTMPITRTARTQTSYISKLDNYAWITKASAYRTHWGVPNLLVLTLTSSEARVRSIIAAADRALGHRPQFLFKVLPDLRCPAESMLAEAWERMGPQALHIGVP